MTWKSRDEKVEMSVENGRLKLGVDLPAAGDNREVPLLVERREVRSCPGSYYLIMTELTDGLRIVLREGAQDVNVEVTFRPSERSVNLTERRVEIIDEPLLPGHCVEFKLTPAKATGI